MNDAIEAMAKAAYYSDAPAFCWEFMPEEARERWRTYARAAASAAEAAGYKGGGRGMTAPRRIQRQRTKGWRMPPGAVYVGRPTIWGNPFVHPDPAEAVAAYRRLIGGGSNSFDMGPGKLQFASNAHANSLHWDYAKYVRDHVRDLRGKDLACWCGPDCPCHADILLELANA